MATRPANWVNPLDYIGTYNTSGQTTAPYPGNPEVFSYDPEAVGGGIARYYGTVSSALPTFEPIQRNIAGTVSPEERRIVGQAAAERGIGIGSYGQGNDLTAYLRAMGTTSRELTNKGIEQYGRMMATIPALSPTSLFITPTDLSRMNLQWATSQADINAAMARQRASDQAALERARISQETAYGTARIGAASQAQRQAAQLAAEADIAAAQRADWNAYQQMRAQRAALAQNYGVGGTSPDPWGGGVSAPSVSAGGGYDSVYNSFGLPGYTGSTGQFYMGEGFASPADEYAYMQDQQYAPYDAYLSQDYYAPGELAYVYDTGYLPTAEDYYYGFE